MGELDVHKLCKKHNTLDQNPSPHLLGVGPSVHVDDEGVALGLREVGRKIKTNLDIIGFVFGKGFQDSFNYLGLVFAAVDRNVQIGNL